MLVIRLRRIGKKNHPTYRVVVGEHRYTPTGRFVADLGFYNPHTKSISVDTEAIVEWMNKGAKPSNTLSKLLKSLKIKHASVVIKLKKAKKTDKGADKPKVEIEAEAEVVAEPAEETEAGDK